MDQITDTVLMIRPASFGFNYETAASNSFQKEVSVPPQIVSQMALLEFDKFVQELRNASVDVILIEDIPVPKKPDAVFPNNWFSTNIMSSGKKFLVTYPMLSELRRSEVRHDIINLLADKFGYEMCDITNAGRVLEGTGSIVYDHKNAVAYAALSPRTDKELFVSLCEALGYKPVAFSATDSSGTEVYHTNVILSIGETFAVICADMIRDEAQRKTVLTELSESGREIIILSEDQVSNFAGNMLQLKGSKGDRVLAMSQSAFDSLDAEQLRRLAFHNTAIVKSNLETIEATGGGSARCMIAEIFH